jgi:hypothetical protein
MDWILLDWTRMARQYCLAGVIVEGNRFPIVRPLLTKFRSAPVRNMGWSPFLMDGHQRWEIFELVGQEPALPEPPHLEDTWVRALRPRRQSASLDQRRRILQSLAVPAEETLFGAPLVKTGSSMYLAPGTGKSSLGTILVPGECISFSGSHREGSAEFRIRMAIDFPPLEGQLLPLKDHHLLLKVEKISSDLTKQLQALGNLVQEMGPQVAVRLGLSRPFLSSSNQGTGVCWLMVDGLFSLAAPEA